MTRTTRQPGPLIPRWARGLATAAFAVVYSTAFTGCGLSYVFRHISPLHPTGWSFAFPILPSQQQRLERDMDKEKRDRVPILDPLPEGAAPISCLDPPNEEEVYRKLPSFRNGSEPFYETQRNNARFLIEKIGDKIDPVKIYPLVGPNQLVHCHYKCTVYYDEAYWSDYPIPFHHVDHRIEVVYIDKDYLRRSAGPAVAVAP